MASLPLVGTRPQRTRDPTHTRDSNALRASVLHAALELGVGTSRAVENLIFDSILEDDENVTTPPLTSASAATSDESWPSVPAWSGIPTDLVLPVRSPPKVAPLTSDVQVVRSPSEDSHLSIIPRPSQHRKLRKARKDGYGSDGSHLSDNQNQKRYNKDQKMGSGSTIDTEYQSDGGYLSDATKRGANKKKKPKDKKGNKIPGEPTADPSAKPFYQSIQKSRNPSDDDDISDGGYLSEATAKRKKTFFGLRSRSPVATRKEAPSDTPPPVPSLPLTPLSFSGPSTRSPNPFNWLDSTPVRTPLDESPDLTSSHPRKDWSPLPPSEIFRSTPSSLSVDTASEDRAPPTTSHEITRYSPSLPLTPTRGALSHAPRLHKSDTRALSPPHPREQKPGSASPALRPYGVRFAPPTRSGSSDDTLSIQKSPLAVITTAEKLPLRPNTSPLTPSLKPKASPSIIPPSPAFPALRTASPMPTQPDLRPSFPPALRSTPSPLMLTPSISPPQRGTSPALSEYSIISSSDFIVPSPRPRFFEDLPPPSPPPTCPLPELPMPGLLHSQPHPMERGRQPPFPMQGGLSVQGTSRLVERTDPTRQEALQAHLAEVQAELQAEIQATTLGDAIDDDVHGDDLDDDLPWLAERVALEPPPPPPRDQEEDGYGWPGDESVRPDIPQFYLYAPPSPSGGAGLAIKRPSPDVPDDERSTYTFSYSAPSGDMRASAVTASKHSDVHSYYFGEADQDGDGDERLLHARFVDDGPSNGMRARLIARADALYGLGKIPPVPKIRPI